MDGHQYLASVLKKYEIDEQSISDLRNKRSYVELLLKQHYGSLIESIRYSGSYIKGTAINIHYDLDICVFFNHDSFGSLKDMFDNLGVFLRSNFALVSMQRVSWSIKFEDGVSVDVVPVRSLGDKSGDAYLYNSKNGTYTKTNIIKQIEYVKSSDVRPIIKLLKVWKYEWKVDIKSFVLELLAIKALEYPSGHYDVDFITVLKYIRDNIESVRLVDPANSSNVVSDLLSPSDKLTIKLITGVSLSNGTWNRIIS